MRIIGVALRGSTGAGLAGPPRPLTPPPGVCALLHDLLWAHATPDTRLEHVRVRPVGPAGLEAVFFLLCRSDADALTAVRPLLERARTPLAAHGYTAVLPVPPA
ncbi:hypothetical protein JS756_25720 [Streptomyces actuosus]|uniref:Uncharacterized protein n=1 Tax=Streptomyces actuosus TaxID=1885 RepID=A0ABS2VWC5_STRAS|nr:hypothetical protein [Streptomyces actuosus]